MGGSHSSNTTDINQQFGLEVMNNITNSNTQTVSANTTISQKCKDKAVIKNSSFNTRIVSTGLLASTTDLKTTNNQAIQNAITQQSQAKVSGVPIGSNARSDNTVKINTTITDDFITNISNTCSQDVAANTSILQEADDCDIEGITVNTIATATLDCVNKSASTLDNTETMTDEVKQVSKAVNEGLGASASSTASSTASVLPLIIIFLICVVSGVGGGGGSNGNGNNSDENSSTTQAQAQGWLQGLFRSDPQAAEKAVENAASEIKIASMARGGDAMRTFAKGIFYILLAIGFGLIGVGVYNLTMGKPNMDPRIAMYAFRTDDDVKKYGGKDIKVIGTKENIPTTIKDEDIEAMFNDDDGVNVIVLKRVYKGKSYTDDLSALKKSDSTFTATKYKVSDPEGLATIFTPSSDRQVFKKKGGDDDSAIPPYDPNEGSLMPFRMVYEYDEKGNPITYKDNDGTKKNVERYQRDSNGQAASSTSKNPYGDKYEHTGCCALGDDGKINEISAKPDPGKKCKSTSVTTHTANGKSTSEPICLPSDHKTCAQWVSCLDPRPKAPKDVTYVDTVINHYLLIKTKPLFFERKTDKKNDNIATKPANYLIDRLNPQPKNWKRVNTISALVGAGLVLCTGCSLLLIYKRENK